MFEITSLRALEIGSERRRELALAEMRAARANEARLREIAGAAIVALGERVAGERDEWVALEPVPVRIRASDDCR